VGWLVRGERCGTEKEVSAWVCKVKENFNARKEPTRKRRENAWRVRTK